MTRAEFDREWNAAEPKVRRRAFSLAHNQDDADDLVMDVYCKLLVRCERIEKLEHCAMVSVRNLFLDHVRHRRRMPTVSYEAVCDGMDITDAIEDASLPDMDAPFVREGMRTALLRDQGSAARNRFLLAIVAKWLDGGDEESTTRRVHRHRGRLHAMRILREAGYAPGLL